MDNHSLRRAVRAPTQVAMFQVRIHGRGGQSVVTAAELLSVAAYKRAGTPRRSPSFGSERTGAPVVAFCRIDDRPSASASRSSRRTR
jgi:Pyruvate/2-oxoacid:ferredoxin oxidoreductase gamma subunit